ncbi:MAG: hypothetical protein KA144_13540 [Xanthomonadaceae bacterium]|nr:hypothetical protein [Xanthomonadaceae bacterium]
MFKSQMSPAFAGLALAFVAALASPGAVRAESGSNPDNDIMACTVSVEYKRSNVSRLVYTRDFVVGPNSPYTDDFSTATRLRFFDATVSRVDNTPQVAVVFDADVDTFNAVQFGATLKVRDASKGETQSGNNSFFTSAAGASGSHRTDYTLTCMRAKL